MMETIDSILEKTARDYTEFRDLANEISADPVLVAEFIDQLDDESDMVRSIAVRTLSMLPETTQDYQTVRSALIKALIRELNQEIRMPLARKVGDFLKDKDPIAFGLIMHCAKSDASFGVRRWCCVALSRVNEAFIAETITFLETEKVKAPQLVEDIDESLDELRSRARLVAASRGRLSTLKSFRWVALSAACIAAVLLLIIRTDREKLGVAQTVNRNLANQVAELERRSRSGNIDTNPGYLQIDNQVATLAKDLALGKFTIPDHVRSMGNHPHSAGPGQTVAPPTLVTLRNSLIPAGTILFQWKHTGGSKYYRIKIMFQNDNFATVRLASGESGNWIADLYDASDTKKIESLPVFVEQTHGVSMWTVKSSQAFERMLGMGKTYDWEVRQTASAGSDQSVSSSETASFEVTNSVTSSDIQAASRKFGNSHLLLSAWLAQRGLIDAARAELQQETDKGSAARLLQSLNNQSP